MLRIIFLLVFPLFVSIVVYAEEVFVPKILYSRLSPFGLIEIVTTRTLGVLNVCENKNYSLAHSIIIEGDLTYLGAEYQPLTTVSFCFLKEIKNALLLGLGAGEFLSYLMTYFSEVHVDAIEINPVMVDIVKEFREIDFHGKMDFVIGDAFRYIAVTNKSYDLIFCDVYFFKPSTTQEYKGFFKNVKKHLNKNGVFVWNAHIPFIPRDVVKDMFIHFEHVIAAVTKTDPNIVFICYQGNEKTEQELKEIASMLKVKHNFRYALPDLIKKFKPILSSEKQMWVSKFPTLA